MSISNSLANAISGMSAASRMAEVVSSNVANSLTEGYGPRSVSLSSAQSGGVTIDSIVRTVDPNVLANRVLADARLGNTSYLASGLSEVQSIVGAPGDEGSLSARIVAVETALIDAANDPSSEIRLSALNSSFVDLANSLNDAADGIQAQRMAADRSIANQIETLNAGLAQIEEMNTDITTAMSTGVDVSALLDARQQVIDSISEIVPIRQLQRDAGQIALMTTSGEMLIDGKAKEYGFTANDFIVADMTLESGALGSITVDGVPLDTDGFGSLEGGTLSAAFQLRDVDLVETQNSLDELAADLINRFQDPNVDDSLAVGEAGILTDRGAAYDSANLTGLAERISVNSKVDPDQGGILTNYRDGVNASTTGLNGDSSLLSALSEVLSDPRINGTDNTVQSAAGRAATLEATVGSKRLSYEYDTSFASSRWSTLKEAEAEAGVDTDYELQVLLRVEQAYAANARVIQTIDTLMQRLMEI